MSRLIPSASHACVLALLPESISCTLGGLSGAEVTYPARAYIKGKSIPLHAKFKVSLSVVPLPIDVCVVSSLAACIAPRLGGCFLAPRAVWLACAGWLTFLVRVCLCWFPALGSDCLCMPNYCVSCNTPTTPKSSTKPVSYTHLTLPTKA